MSPLADHLRSPYHRGRIEHPTLEVSRSHSVCGDRVELQLRLEPGTQVILEAWHQGTGCLISQAGASMLCEHIEGKSLVELTNFSREAMLELMGITLTPMRRECALLGFYALQQVVGE